MATALGGSGVARSLGRQNREPPASSRLGASSSSSCGVNWSSRTCSHTSASTSGRAPSSSRAQQQGPHLLRPAMAYSIARPNSRGRLQVAAALFQPPDFRPAKLSVAFLPGATPTGPAPPAAPRRYTLTHNDVTGALALSIGAAFNAEQTRGLYTRLLRDEVRAEWWWLGREAPAATPTAAAELRVYVHVSGGERWLAPPALRDYIFRREMTLVLDTLLYAERALLDAQPALRAARVRVHFESHVPRLHRVDDWGSLGDRGSWARPPRPTLEGVRDALLDGGAAVVPAVFFTAAAAAPEQQAPLPPALVVLPPASLPPPTPSAAAAYAPAAAAARREGDNNNGNAALDGAAGGGASSLKPPPPPPLLRGNPMAVVAAATARRRRSP